MATAFVPPRLTDFRKTRQTAATLARQTVLDLPASPPRLTRATFIVSASNEGAVKTFDAWLNHGEGLLVICGPEGSGKTHLLCILRSESASDGPLLNTIDDADGAAPGRLLAEVEAAREAGARIVLAGRGEPRDWAKGLKDLETRLNAAPRITLVEPDEALLRAVMTKIFKDRQLRAPEAIAGYAAPRLPKTFAAAQAFVAALDALSIEKGVGVSLKLAREAVANLSEEAFEA